MFWALGSPKLYIGCRGDLVSVVVLVKQRMALGWKCRRMCITGSESWGYAVPSFCIVPLGTAATEVPLPDRVLLYNPLMLCPTQERIMQRSIKSCLNSVTV